MRMTHKIQGVAAAVLVASAATASAQTASATYDPSTGEIGLTIGSGIGVAGFESASGVLRPTSLSDALVAAQADTRVIGFFNPSGLPVGDFALGAIVTPGTDVSDLGFSFTPVGGQSAIGPITVVPEPASLGLLALGGLALVGRRRR